MALYTGVYMARNIQILYISKKQGLADELNALLRSSKSTALIKLKKINLNLNVIENNIKLVVVEQEYNGEIDYMADDRFLQFMLICQIESIPVIFLCSNTDIKYIRSLYNAGCEDYISHPISAEALLIKIDKLLMSSLSYRELENDLQISERKNKALIAQIEHGICYISTDFDRIYNCNQQLLYILGYTRTETKGMSINDIIHPDYREELYTNALELVSGKAISYETETKVINKAGDIRWVKMNLIFVEVVDSVSDSIGGPADSSIDSSVDNSKDGYFQCVIYDINNYKLLEDRLAQSEKRFTDMAESLLDWVWELDAQGRYTYSSGKIMVELGYTKEDFIGKEPGDVMSPDSGATIKNLIKKYAVKQKNIEDLQVWTHGKKGNYVCLSVRAVPMYDDHKNFVGYRGISKDVTEQVTAEQQLKEKEEHLELAIQAGNLGIWDWDIVNNHLKWDDALFDLYDVSKEDFTGVLEDWYNILHPDDFDKATTALQEAIHGARNLDAIFRIITPKGEVKYVHAIGVTSFDANGKALGMIGVNYNLTHQKHIEEEIKKINLELEERVAERTSKLKMFSEAVEQSPASVLITDTNGIIIYANKIISTLTGYSFDEVLGKKPSLFKSGKLDRVIYAELWKTITAGHIWRGEFLNMKKDGSLYWEDASISPIIDENGIITHYIAIKEDITEYKNMFNELEIAKEKAESATKAKSDFLANMSHEIRTPMNAVIGLSHLALKTNLNYKQADYINKINIAGKSLLGIINDILDFSKIEAGKLDIEHIGFNLNDVFSNIINISMFKAEEKGLELVLDIDENVPRHLMGDPLRIGQILMNLINNAIKFSVNGDVIIRVKCMAIIGNIANLEFRVIDFGVGLNEKQKEELFHSFKQGDASTTREFGGTGLGLAISKNLVDIMGGKIDVVSEEGKGSQFFFELPFEMQTAIRNREVKDNGIFYKKKVLVIDNNSVQLDVTKRYLEKLGCIVDITTSGVDGYILLKERYLNHINLWDVIIVDRSMPNIDGFDFVKLAKLLMKNIAYPEFILVTRKWDDNIEQQCKMLGIIGFIIKPITPDVLKDSLYNILVKSSELIDGIENNYPISNSINPLSDITNSRILLVEDNEINQEIIVGLLEPYGVHIDVVVNGKVAVDTILAGKDIYDLVLMDLQMPVMDGYEATLMIREVYTEEELPIVAVTAEAMAGIDEKVKKAGMNDCITKPINQDALFIKILKWIKGQSNG